MRNKKKLKRIGTLLAKALILLQISGQIFTPACGWINKRNSTINTENGSVRNLETYADSLDTRDFLNLANGQIHLNANENHVCKHYSNSTFQEYQRLLECAGRTDLSDKIRMASGTGFRIIGHSWIEINEKGKWIPYESTRFTPDLSANEVKEYSGKTHETKSKLVQAFTMDEAETRTFAGTQTPYLTSKGSLIYLPSTIWTLAKLPFANSLQE